MLGRPIALAGLLGAAVGGPYLASQAPDDWASRWGASPPAEAQAEASAWSPDQLNFRAPNLAAPNGPGSEVYESPAPLAGPVGIGLEQALNWNVTKNWVYQQWARKSTGLSDPRLFGVRVPLVTGSGMTDVAGSLTYYFDKAGVLQRMRLVGQTADTSRIAHLATTRFGMTPRTALSPGDQLFQAVQSNTLRGQLRTRPEGTLWATSPHQSFAVQFEVTRPGSPFVVTPTLPKLELPEGVAAQVASKPTGEKPLGDPIFPSRQIVPDATARAETAKATQGAAEAGNAGKLPTPKLPKLGSPTAAPPAKIEPLDGYRDRFRWPG